MQVSRSATAVAVVVSLWTASLTTMGQDNSLARDDQNNELVMTLVDNILDPTLPAIGDRASGALDDDIDMNSSTDEAFVESILDELLPGRSSTDSEVLHRILKSRVAESFFVRYLSDSRQEILDASIAAISEAADGGVAEAQYSLGALHGAGVISGGEANRFQWYRRAAAQGHIAAQASLGACYFAGLGVAPDYTQGRRWLLRSARRGHVRAQHALGALYEHGELGFRRNCAEAVRWYRGAAAQGYDVPEYMRPAEAVRQCSW